jgi:hypothetical protein
MASDYVGGGVVSRKEAYELRQHALRRGGNISLIDPVTDTVWARYASDGTTKRPSNYFDYYFTGQDIKVRIAEIPESDKEFGFLPIAALAANIEQEKQPIFGFWSYVFDAVMRGTRMVSGAFSLVTTYPDYMTECLAAAAKYRSTREQIDNYNYPQALTEDDKNIEHYWGRNLYDPGITANSRRHIHSVHPPFSLIIIYNLETTAMPLSPGAPPYQQYYVSEYEDSSNAVMTDHNQRISEIDPFAHQNRLVIDNVEIRGCQREFTPDGAVCTETYTFFARDIVVPAKPGTGTPKLVAGTPT